MRFAAIRNRAQRFAVIRRRHVKVTGGFRIARPDVIGIPIQIATGKSSARHEQQRHQKSWNLFQHSAEISMPPEKAQSLPLDAPAIAL